MPQTTRCSAGAGWTAAFIVRREKGLLAECRKLGGCETGKVKVTAGYDLPCKYVIHAVGPRWFGGKQGEPALLRSCYLNALEAARERGCESIAFPLISSGIFGCPKQIALRIAVDAIRDFLAENEMLVCLVIYNRSEFPLEDGLRRDISKYINDSFLTDTTGHRGAFGMCADGCRSRSVCI